MTPRLRLLHPHGVLLVTSASFVALACAALLMGALPADLLVREALLGLGSPDVIAFMRLVNTLGHWHALLPGTLLLYVVFRRARERWWIWLVLMLSAPAAESFVKVMIGRPRPDDASWGFPSGHSTAAAAFFGAVMYLAGSLPAPACHLVRALAPVAILLVGAARVILRAHWPSDVLGGFALGLALAAAAALLAATPPEAAAAVSSQGEAH